MATDDVRAALRASDAPAAHRAFLQLADVDTTYEGLLETVLHEDYAVGWTSLATALAFLQLLPNPQFALAGCHVLHNVHITQQTRTAFTNVPVLRLAAFVEEVIAKIDDEVAKARAETLAMEWFSATVRAAVRGEPLMSKSALRQQVLYVAMANFAHDDARRNVFTWHWAWEDDGNVQHHFVAEPVDDTWESVRLRSVEFNELLITERVEDNTTSLESRRIFTRRRDGDGEEDPDVGPSGQWRIQSQDGTANRSVFVVYSPLLNEFLYSPQEEYDDDRHFVATSALHSDDDEFEDARQWIITPVNWLPMDQGIEKFHSGQYEDAVSYFPVEIDQDLGPDDSFRYCVYRLACKLRAGQDSVNDVEYDNLEALGGRETAARFGLVELWDEITVVTTAQRLEEPTKNPAAYVARLVRQGDRLVVSTAYHDALVRFTEATDLARALLDDPNHTRDRDAVDKQLTLAMFASAKMLFALGRSAEAIPLLTELQARPSLSLALQSRVLLWTARCQRVLKDDPVATIAMLQRALDALAVSETGDDSLRQSIALEMFVATIKTDGPVSSVQQLIDTCRCPISLEIMVDPVVTPSGVSYERAMIEQHLRTNGPFDPMTHAQLTLEQLYPNRMLQQLLEKVRHQATE